MKRIIRFLGVSILCTVASSCGKPSPDKELVGAWELDTGRVKRIWSFTPDHRFTMTCADESLSSSEDGTWSVNNGTLDLHADKSTINPERAGGRLVTSRSSLSATRC